MPPKQKYTRESILQTSLNIAKRDGLSSVVARNVGKELGCTVSPIFSYFKNMDALMNADIEELSSIRDIGPITAKLIT